MRSSRAAGKIVEGQIFSTTRRVRLPLDEMRKIRGRRMAMTSRPDDVAQSVLKISTQLMEVTELHLRHSKQQAREQHQDAQDRRIPEAHERIENYPMNFRRNASACNDRDGPVMRSEC